MSKCAECGLPTDKPEVMHAYIHQCLKAMAELRGSLSEACAERDTALRHLRILAFPPRPNGRQVEAAVTFLGLIEERHG
jgi:hypothetical protein